MNLRTTLPAAFLLLCASALAGASDNPYDLVAAARHAHSPYDEPYVLFRSAGQSAVRDTALARIVRIDDMPVWHGRAGAVPPGLHEVELSVPGPPGMNRAGRHSIVIDARPCTRYYLAAKRSSRTSRKWDAFVESSEIIGECERKFMR